MNFLDEIKKGHNFVILGGPGTSKTTTLKGIFEQCHSDKKVQCLAPTGISAINLPNGRTIDSYFKLGDGRFTYEEVIVRIKEDRKVKEDIEQVQLLLIDEISMVSAFKLDMVSCFLPN